MITKKLLFFWFLFPLALIGARALFYVFFYPWKYPGDLWEFIKQDRRCSILLFVAFLVSMCGLVRYFIIVFLK